MLHISTDAVHAETDMPSERLLIPLPSPPLGNPQCNLTVCVQAHLFYVAGQGELQLARGQVPDLDGSVG